MDGQPHSNGREDEVNGFVVELVDCDLRAPTLKVTQASCPERPVDA